jgi:hypothetical protein
MQFIRGNDQKPSTQPGQELAQKNERWLSVDLDVNPGA